MGNTMTNNFFQTYNNLETSGAYWLNNNNINITEEQHQIHDDNLEIFSIIWLDAEVNITEENQRAQLELRKIINHLKIFEDQDQCHQQILSLSPQDRLVLIISGRCGRQLVPQIHQLRQVSSIYVYCRDKQENEQWTKDFIKIRSVIIRLDELIYQIQIDQKRREKIEEPLSMNIFALSSNNRDHSTTELNGHFVHSLLLIDVLIRLKYCETDKQNLITYCKNKYKNNEIDLAFICEFKNQYSANKALWWYTRESFLYKMLNQALRVQNIEVLFLFRSVIADIYQQLKENQCQSSVRVYRGQVISNDELKILKQSIGEFISINSFFSTSITYEHAMNFLENSNISNNLHRVLFEIDTDPSIITLSPYANISDFSYFKDEGEVLFMAGCVFRLVDVTRKYTKSIWVIRMKLCGGNEYNDLKNLFDHLKKEYGGGGDKVTLHYFGDVLNRMGKYDLAEKIYHRLLDELPRNDLSSLPHLYRSLGILNRTKADYPSSSLQLFQEALDIQIRNPSANHADIADLYKRIGIAYSDNNNFVKALENYNLAVEYYYREPDRNQLNMADIYHNIGVVYKRQEKYSAALEFYNKSLIIKQEHLPRHHSSIATSHNNIGNIYLYDHQYDVAMAHHKLALQIRLKSLPPQHPDFATSYRNIGLVHENKCKWKKALDRYKKSADIYHHSFPPQHPHIIRIEGDIQRVSSKFISLSLSDIFK